MTQKYKVYINNKAKIVTENWKDFSDNYKVIEAAGGLVFNQKNEILMIFRNGKWDLPKGKLEVGESIESCAIREVEEECGVPDLKIIKKLKDTFHTYEINGEKILKKIFWYKMNSNFDGELIPQTIEGITKVCWVKGDEISEKMKNSYGNIKDVLDYE